MTRASDDLSTTQGYVDLREEYPLSWRSILRRSWVWLSVYALVLTLAVFHSSWVSGQDGTAELFTDMLNFVLFYCVLGGLILCSGKLLYEILYYCWYEFGLESGNLVVTEGVIVRSRSSFPLVKVTDVYLDRHFIDVVLFLWNINVSTPNPTSSGFGHIRGLRRDVAISLQDYITDLLDAINPRADEAVTDSVPISVKKKAKE